LIDSPANQTLVLGGGGGWLGRNLVDADGLRPTDVRLALDDFGSTVTPEMRRAQGLVICETLSPVRALSLENRARYLDNMRYLFERTVAKVFVFVSSAITAKSADDLSAERAAYRVHKIECEHLMREYAGHRPDDRFFILRPTAIIGEGCHSNFLCEAKRRLLAGNPVVVSNSAKRVSGFVGKGAIRDFIALLATSSGTPRGVHAVTLAARDAISIGEIVTLMIENGYSAVTCTPSETQIDDDLYDITDAVSLGFKPDNCRALIQAFLGER
jgi:nucleoside-diphosphate-sugar epimerase